MKKSVKSIALLMAALVLMGIMSTFSPGVAAQTAPVMSIDMCNLSFRSNICIKFAVTSDSTAETVILVWDAPRTDEYTYGTHTEELETVGNSEIRGGTYKIYDYTSLFAKQMTDVIYARPYTKIGDTEYYGDVVKYSILQYSYDMLGKTGTATDNELLKNLITAMLEYGAMTQKCLDYKTDRLATDDFYQVILKGGLIDDMCAYGLYLEGDMVNIVAPEKNEEDVAFTAWKDSAGNVVSTSASCAITVGNKNETYTAEYKKTSMGLEFDTNGDGTCCLVSSGDCEDTELVIPMKSPDGDIVTSIDSSAFAGEAITSVTIPTTIEEIGRKAFNGCDSLTDVYYEGSEDEWNVLCDSIGTGNDALLDATIHFAKISSYTVKFVDYDNTVLNEQKVAPGEAAIAPAAPARDGHIFVGWDKAFDNITGDLVVIALYEVEPTYTEPTIVVKNVTANAGDTVEVLVNLYSNPGILGMTLKLEFDEEAMTLTGVEKGTALSEMTFTAPKGEALKNGCELPWDAEEVLPENVTNGNILKLTFEIADDAESGDYDVTLSYNNGAVIDNDMLNVDLVIVNGKISVN